MAGVALTLAAASAAPPAPPAGVTITVATWNVAWFGDGEGDGALTGNREGGRHLRGPEDFARLRAVALRIEALGADLVSLQEMENRAAAARLFPESDWELFVSSRNPDPAWSQRTALAVRRDAGWTVERHPDVIEWSPQGRDRYGVDLTLGRGAERVRVLAVHFQSGCQYDALRSARRQCGVLRMQFAVLKGWLHERMAEGFPVVVAGDWNRFLSRPGADAVPTFPVRPLILPRPGRAPACWDGHFDNYVDHILAFPPAGDAVKGSGVEEILYRAPLTLRDRLSDHCPLSATLHFFRRRPPPPAGDALSASR